MTLGERVFDGVRLGELRRDWERVPLAVDERERDVLLDFEADREKLAVVDAVCVTPFVADGERVVEKVTDAESDVLAATLREPVVDAVNEVDADIDRDVDARTVADRVTDRDRDAEMLPERDRVLDTDGLREPVGTDALTEAVREAERVFDEIRDGERLSDKVRDGERLKLNDRLAVKLGLRVTLAVVDGDTEALASHWQHACLDAPQLSSATAPLTNALGVRTPMQAPAPVGAAWPAAGVPHQLAFVA